MTWLTLRLQRAELILLLVAIFAIGAACIATFDEARIQARTYTNEECPVPLTQSGPTQYCYIEASTLYGLVQDGVDILLLAPLAAALLLGIPLLMELRDRTYQLVWVQSVTRRSWVGSRLAVIGLVGLAVTIASILVTRWWEPDIEPDFWSKLRPFDLEGIVSFGWLAFAIGVTLALGTIIRRPLIAIVLSSVTFLLARLLFREEIRPIIIPPETAQTEPLASTKEGAWIISQWYTGADGTRLSSQEFGGICQQLNPAGATTDFEQRFIAYRDCLTNSGIHFVYEYHSESRFWPLQFIETGIFLALGLALISWTVWYWLRRLE